MPILLQRAPRNDLRPFSAPAVPGLPNFGAGTPAMTPATRSSNFGAGQQPMRRAPGDTNPAPYMPRNLGTLTSADLNRTPTGSALNQGPALTGAPVTGNAMSTVATRAPGVGSRTTYDQFLANNPASSAAIGQDASLAANTPATPAYRPPQQTERANPLTGANNIPMEGKTTPLAPAPFVQRGAGLPAGQDAAPAVKQRISEDDDIGRSMQGTQNRLRASFGSNAPIGGTGAFARRFGSQNSANAYQSYLTRIFPQGVT